MPGKRKTSGWDAYRDRAGICSTTMIPTETRRAFEDLHRELYEEFLPVGTTEEGLIRRLADLTWERDRLYRYLQFKMEIRKAELSDQVPRAQFFADLKSDAIEIRNAKIMEEVERFFSKVEDIANGKQSPPEKCQQSQNWRDPKIPGKEIVEGLASLEIGPINDRDIFFKLVEEFPIIERLKQFEQIDVAIDRTIKRFIQVKTMKQMYRQLEPKVISISQDKKISAKK